jgi:hypothetical protein
MIGPYSLPLQPEIEGDVLGADKVAHFLFVLAVAGWLLIFGLAPVWAVLIPTAAGIIWEASNRWFVIKGRKGASLYDLMGFLVGGVAAGILAAVLARGG